MDNPIVFISHNRVREGQLDGLRRFMAEGTRDLEADKPRTLLFLAYLNETQSELTIIHAFAAAASMDAHLEGVAERSAAAYEFIESLRFEIYGQPSPQALEMMGGAAARAGIEFTVHPEFADGFLRAKQA